MEERQNQQGRQPQQDQGNMGQQGSRQQGMGAGQEFPRDNVRGSQHGGQAGSGQQQQLDMQGSGHQSGGSGSDSRFADQIRGHMELVDSNGQHCGTVDHVEGDRIKLTRSDVGSGEHHYVPLGQVAGVEGNKVRLRERGDNDFGMEGGR